MKKKYIWPVLFIILSVFLWYGNKLTKNNISAQTNFNTKLWEIAAKFNRPYKNTPFIYETYGVYPFQWFAWYQIGTFNIAVNLVVSEKEKTALENDPWILFKALHDIYREYPMEVMEIVQREYRTEFHRPGQYYPMFLYYEIVRPQDVLLTDPVKNYRVLGDHPDGWFVRILEISRYNIMFAVKEVGNNEYLISVPLFMRLLKYPGSLDEPLPEQFGFVENIGWTIKDGEKTYYEALNKWVEYKEIIKKFEDKQIKE